MRKLFAAALLALALPAGAVTLDDLRRTLTELRGATAFSVRIDSTHRQLDGKKNRESSGTSIAEDDGGHIRLVYDKALLRNRKKDERTDPNVGAAEADELMNYAPALLEMLEGAKLVRATQTTLDGTAATLLEITPAREKSDDDDKWVKSFVDELRVWVGPGGIPIAAERTLQIKARVVVISAEFGKKDKLRFTRAGDRLVATKRTTESSSSGMGQNANSVKSVAVAVR